MKKALIIGGGAAGCAAAHQLTLMGDWDILLVEKAPFLGAGVRTFYHGGHPFTYGPRHFLTQNQKVYEYLNTHLPLRSCSNHQFITYVPDDSDFYNFPIHKDDIERMPNKGAIESNLSLIEHKRTHGLTAAPNNFEEFWIGSVGEQLYHKMVDGYSKKMWKVKSNTELDTFNWSPKGTVLKSGPRAAWDTAISAYPFAADGYNSWFDIATAGATVKLSTEIQDYNYSHREVRIDNEWLQFDVLISTISPDIPFHFEAGKLPYVGRDFYKMVLPIRQAFPFDVYLVYDAGNEPFTRLTEYKKFTHHDSPHTLISMEIPSWNGAHYPIPIKKYQQVAEVYFQAFEDNVFSMGRSGSYRYGLDVAACIEQSFELVEMIKQGGQEHPVPGKKWRLT